MGFLTYKKFNDQEGVDTLTSILRTNGIEYEIAEDRESLDSLYGDKHFKKEYSVKIKSTDFSIANEILERESLKELETVSKDHYLYDFTDEELFDILIKPDEWNDLDFQLAKRILKERGREVNPDTLELLKTRRINELAKPEEGQKNWIIAGYLFALLGGLLGIFIGWHLSTFKKTLPNGQRVFGYNQNDRKQGNRILILGIIMFVMFLGLKFYRLQDS